MGLINWLFIRALIYDFFVRWLEIPFEEVNKAMDQIPQLKLDKDD